MKTALVLGSSGFIGGHMVRRLKSEGYWVRGADLKRRENYQDAPDEFRLGDLRSQIFTEMVCKPFHGGSFDLIIQLAADMGGAGYIFTGDHDADIMHNSAYINLNVIHAIRNNGFKGRLFYSSSACMYPKEIQEQEDCADLKEEFAYPGNPDSEYGWEKLFSERIYLAHARNLGFEIRIARFHNIFGPEGTWIGGKEKAPAAICRKVAEVEDGGTIEIWGDGNQTRSFLYIDECVEGVMRLLESDCRDVVNIGSNERISINDLVKMVCEISGKTSVFIKHIPGPEGVRGRNSENGFIREKLGWAPSATLRDGMAKTYLWIERQVYNGNIQ